MSFKRFDPEDLVISADSVVTPTWSTGATILETFLTSSAQETSTSGNYYLDVYQADPATTGAEVQFSITYGHPQGSGSAAYNSAVVGKSPSATIYGQYRSLLLGDEDSKFFADETKGIYAININRSRYKEKLKVSGFLLYLNIGDGDYSATYTVTPTATTSYSDAGRVYDLQASMSSNDLVLSAGKLYPDDGIIILSAKPLVTDGILVDPSTDTNQKQANRRLWTALTDQAVCAIILSSEETITSNYVFVRTRNSEFNYTNNPSAITGSGELRHTEFINNPRSYITSVGLYNDNNDLLAIAKLSTPIQKDFTKEALLRIKLDF